MAPFVRKSPLTNRRTQMRNTKFQSRALAGPAGATPLGQQSSDHRSGSDRIRPEFGKLIALDIEADPPRPTRSTVSGRQRAASRILGSVVRVTSFAVLDLAKSKATLQTCTGEESSILAELDDLLGSHIDALLLTFNGLSFDLPLIRWRATSHLMFGAHGLRTLADRDHVDVMRLLPDRPSLDSVATTFGIDVDPKGMSRAQKCELDVLQTLLIYLHADAYDRGDARFLSRGWSILKRDVDLRLRGHLAPLFEGIAPD